MRHRPSDRRGAGSVNSVSTSLSIADDYMLCKIIWHVLDLISLIPISRVCRRWSQLARQADCWAGKRVHIGDLSLYGLKLQEWCNIWRLADVLMIYPQKDSLQSVPLRTHLVRHPWSCDNQCRPWTRIVSESRGEWMACVTRHRGPEGACLIQVHNVNGITQHIETPVCLGWTTAANPSSLAIMSDRYSARNTRQGDLILELSLLPLGSSPTQIAAELSGEAAILSPPINFDVSGSILASVRLDRARRTISFGSAWDEDDNMFRDEGECEFPGAAITDDMNLNFFIATPMDRARDLPRTRLPLPRLDWTLFEAHRASPRCRTGPLPAQFA